MTDRKCGTCKHYEPAPIWRKGWCRNPLLYAPQQSHLVGEDDLDCDRGMGDYWEPMEAEADDAGSPPQGAPAPGSQPAAAAYLAPDESPLMFMGRRNPGEVAIAGGEGDMSHFSGGGGRRGDGDEEEDDVHRVPSYGDRSRPPFTSGQETRTSTYYAEERYWTDYLRIAAPVLGVIFIVVLGWLVLTRALGGGSSDKDPGTAAGAGTVITSTTSPTAQIITGSPSPLSTSVPTTGTGTGTTGPTPTAIGPGVAVVVSGTGGSGVNMRDEPSIEGEIVASLDEGTKLQVTGASVAADGYTWWPVKSDEFSGYVAADFLKLNHS